MSVIVSFDILVFKVIIWLCFMLEYQNKVVGDNMIVFVFLLNCVK